MPFHVPLPHRNFVAIRGPDRVSFLQGLISNDMTRVADGAAIWAALLTPQGKFLHEFFVFACPDATGEDAIWLECESLRREDLVGRLMRYRLRAKVSILAEDTLAAGVTWDKEALDNTPGALAQIDGGVVYTDPRLPQAGKRWALPPNHITRVWADVPRGAASDYDAFRMSLGLPDGSRDMEVEKALLLENGFEELNGVDYEKGCYIGQELTARTHYRALIKKRLLPVAVNGMAPTPGTVLTSNGVEVGEMRSAIGDWGLALVKLDVLGSGNENVLTAAGGAKMRPFVPTWMRLPQERGAAKA
jgi:folate-binding protein YgfZ